MPESGRAAGCGIAGVCSLEEVDEVEKRRPEKKDRIVLTDLIDTPRRIVEYTEDGWLTEWSDRETAVVFLRGAMPEPSIWLAELDNWPAVVYDGAKSTESARGIWAECRRVDGTASRLGQRRATERVALPARAVIPVKAREDGLLAIVVSRSAS